MTGHPVQLPRSSQYRRFALASHQGEVVVFRGPTPESMAVPSMGGPSLFSFPRCPELLMYHTVLALRIRMCMLFAFDFFFSCLSSHFFFPILRRGCIFSCGSMLSLPFWHVCAPFGTCVRTALVAHACMIIVHVLVVVRMLAYLSYAFWLFWVPSS